MNENMNVAFECTEDPAQENDIPQEERVYPILEGNMPRLQKKLNAIRNKCEKYGCEFHYEEVGEEYRDVKIDDDVQSVRFILVKAYGIAKVNGWQFVAVVEHTAHGNIIRSIGNGIEVPERYYHADKVCEHCGSKRNRTDTYIVMNTETGKFMQVGKTCLKDLTNGLNASLVALYISYFDTLIEGEAPIMGGSYEYYMHLEEYMRYAAECIRVFGYVRNTEENRINGILSTANRAFIYYRTQYGASYTYEERKSIIREMEVRGIDPDRPDSQETVRETLEWIRSSEDNGNYMHNLRTICAETSGYVQANKKGLLASAITSYQREMGKRKERELKAQERKNEFASSEYVGEIQQRISFMPQTVRLATSWETLYGYTYLYIFKDENGNCIVWKASKSIDTDQYIEKITGTVKEHSEYNGVKQTIVTRCKVNYKAASA